MAEDEEGGLDAFLAGARARATATLPARAERLRAEAERVAAGDEDAREPLLREVHKLRGLGGTIGRDDLSERAGRLEDAMRKGASPVAIVEGARRLAAAIDAPPPALRGGGGAEPAATARARLHGSVFVIDDEGATRVLLARLLTAAGCEVFETGDPLTFVERARAHPPDLAIVDAMMPTATGLDLYEALRALPGEPVRVVILSATTAADLGWTLPEDPRLRWMHKPFRPDALLVALRTFLAE